MKKVLLFSLLILFSFTQTAFAYETIIIDFPPKSKWVVAYYQRIDTETILQYVPDGQNGSNWKQTIVVHSYKDYDMPASRLIQSIAMQMMQQNPTGRYKYFRLADFDAVGIRATQNYRGIKAQCEILRATDACEGMVTIQYIDRDKKHFQQNYKTWLKIVKDARTYNSYWQDNRILNKAESYEI